MGVGLWPGQQRGCWELGVNLGAWGPGFRGAPFTSICRTLDTASPTGNSKDPRATTFRDTAAAVVGTTEKPTGRAEPAGTSTCWASPPPPGRHRPSTGDTWTLTWGQEDGDGQARPVRLPTPCPPSSHRPPVHAGSHRASQSDFYPGSCRGQAAAQAAQSGGQRRASGGAGGILGTLGAGQVWPHTGLREGGAWGRGQSQRPGRTHRRSHWGGVGDPPPLPSTLLGPALSLPALCI